MSCWFSRYFIVCVVGHGVSAWLFLGLGCWAVCCWLFVVTIWLFINSVGGVRWT